MKKLVLFVIGCLVMLTACSTLNEDPETDHIDAESVDILLDSSNAYYTDVVRVAKRFVSGQIFKVVIEDKVLYNQEDEVYSIYLSEIYSETSNSYEEAVDLHRNNYNGNSDYKVSIQRNDDATWQIIDYCIID